MCLPIYYFIWETKEGNPSGWLATEDSRIPGAREVTREEFIRLGGDPDNIVHSDTYYKIKEIEEKRLLEAQIQATSDRNDFLEDCIAEMAAVIYS